MTHGITAREPIMQKSRWEWDGDGATQVWKKDTDTIDIPALYSYQCDCGESFDEWEDSTRPSPSIRGMNHV